MRLLYHIVHSGYMHFRGEIKKIPKSKKVAPRKKVALGLFYHRLGHRYTRLLMALDTKIFWQDIELRIYPNPFCTSCQISSMNKKARSKNPLKPKSPFKWIFYGYYSRNRTKTFDN